MKKQKDYSEGTTRLYAHTIEWWLEGYGHGLTDNDVEHICNMLAEDYVQGELCSITPNDNEVLGWWKIKR